MGRRAEERGNQIQRICFAFLAITKTRRLFDRGSAGVRKNPIFCGWIVGSAYHPLGIAKSNFGSAALILRLKFLRLGVFATANEIPGKEDCFQVLHWHFRAFALGGLLLKKRRRRSFCSKKLQM